MFCAECAEETPTAPCSACGADPLLEARYRLEHVLGRGATGTTWAATRLSDGELVAIKAMVLKPGLGDKERELVAREVDVLRQLRHPAIPALLDAFVRRAGGGVGLQYLVQEFVPGRTLAEDLATRRYSEADVLGVIDETAAILDYLHRLSPPVVHRDVKPANLMLRPDGALALIDFGAVKDAVNDAHVGGNTVAGTFGFMAPEQFQGDADPRSDLYALGATAVALLTREEPRLLLDASRRLSWRHRCDVSDGIADLIDALLAAAPDDRPTSAADLRARIDRLRNRAPTPDLPRPTVPPVDGSPSGAATLGVLAVIGLLVAGVVVAGLSGSERPEKQSTASAQCGAEPCAPAGGFAIRSLALGQTVDEARASFPELAGAETLAPERIHPSSAILDPLAYIGAPAVEVPGPYLQVRTLVADAPATCALSFADGERLSAIRCEIDGAGTSGAHTAVVDTLRAALEARHGGVGPPTGQSFSFAIDRTWTWADDTGQVRLHDAFSELGGFVVEDITLEATTSGHAARMRELEAEAERRLADARRTEAAEKEAARLREVEALRRGSGPATGGGL